MELVLIIILLILLFGGGFGYYRGGYYSRGGGYGIGGILGVVLIVILIVWLARGAGYVVTRRKRRAHVMVGEHVAGADNHCTGGRALRLCVRT